MSQRRARKKRAVKDALSRLGLQARPAEVVAALAARGIAVSQGLVRAVAFELLRVEARAERQRCRGRPQAVGQPPRRFAKVPPRRGERR
jgi:hypothetical protein